ncbi:hypothetical protein VY88_26605 [Azospirillum thiophilum]|uniref:Uncharacterized protein n=1 Tax=Azospirillum thiophilum TaxID=528244 RepID=A0AAC8ZWA9_9PROT|nr:hypothetical protein [Azospirillum thiophilum]ALG75097.1 hypothetical protein AL072_29510 [Azospirillum thiophilum]KJR62492.1 hypothetical protein VY88_26605 [Azospirillum thiophilum]
MSYLTGPRLTFTGKFIADVSTVNNHDYAYKDDKRYTAEDYAGWKIGYWNPYGTGVWRLTDCKVTGAVTADGRPVAADPVLGLAVTDADDRPPAKMVDLDTDQQMVSAIWGLLVRLTGVNGLELLRGDFDVASFTDLWARNWSPGKAFEHPPHPPAYFGASFQSVLKDLAWGDVSASAFLTALKEAAADGLLSIKFNVTGYNAGYGVNPPDHIRYLPNPPDFTTGVLTGSIGVARKDEPRFFTLGRRIQPVTSDGNAGSPVPFYYATAAVDEAAGRLSVDLGNSIPFREWRGAMVDQPLQVGYFGGAQGFVKLADVAPGNEWYETTAGIVDIALTGDQLAAVGSNPLAVYSPTLNTILGQESPDGRVVKADEFVFRMSPGDSTPVTLWATKFGKPLEGAEIAVALDPSGLSGYGGSPAVGVPEAALTFPDTLTTDAAGKAELVLTGGDPGEPRKADDIDGQVYGVRPAFADATPLSYYDPFDFISVLLWSPYAVPEKPTWEQDIEPILFQYANLYPVMLPVLDMSDYDSVRKHLYSLQVAMSLPVEDPNYMPVVRDLSPAKREAVLKWAADPVRGEVTAPKPPRSTAVSPEVQEALSWLATKPIRPPFLRK